MYVTHSIQAHRDKFVAPGGQIVTKLATAAHLRDKHKWGAYAIIAPMMQIALSLFGTFGVTVNGQAVTTFATDKARGLLAYLALQPALTHRRETLAALFWPELDQQAALTNLRQTFHRLRAGLARVAPGSDDALFTATRQTIQLNRALLTVDVAQFSTLLAASESHAHQTLADCLGCRTRLADAVALYRGELLAGFGVNDAPPFEEWLLLRREFYHQQALLVCQKLTLAHASREDYAQAHRFAARQLELDPYREDAHRQVMQLLAVQGLTSQALAQYERCRQILHDELGVAPDAETLRLAEQIRAGELEDKMTRRQGHERVLSTRDDKMNKGHPVSQPSSHLVIQSSCQPAIPHNLPAQLTALVGRDEAVAELYTRLQDRAVRLLTIVGAGGMGKTRLALAVGEASYELRVTNYAETGQGGTAVIRNSEFVTHPYPDGIFFVPLAALTSATEVAPAIATAVGLTVQGNPQQVVLQGLRDRRLLLILDNFEHLLEAAGFVVELLQGAPAIQIIITSRERLQVRGEHLYQLAALAYEAAVPEETHLPTDLAAVCALSSVQLFQQSAQRLAANFALTAENAPDVLAICRLVQGMPLGVELATAWIGTLTPAEIAEAIAQSSDILAVDWRDAPVRQRSMRAVFHWSWHLLTPHEQRVLRQLAIFRGGFTRQAAQQVVAGAWPTLVSLVQKSLLVCEQGTDGERYAMHELLRQLAAEQLAAAPDEQRQSMANHCHFYLGYLADCTPRLAHGEPRQACDEIGLALDNLRQAWQWGATNGAVDALRGALFSWWQFCVFRGLEYEGRRSFALAVTATQAWVALQPDVGTTRQQGEALLSSLLAIHANYLFAQGQDEQMAALAREAIALGQKHGNRGGAIFGHFVLGRALQEFGKLYEAAVAWQTAIDLAHAHQQQEQRDELANEIYWMAHIWLHGNRLALEKYAESQALLAQALHFCQTAGKVRGQMECGSSLALSHVFRGEYGAARQQYEQLLQIARDLGSRRQEMVAQIGLGSLCSQLGEYTLAQTLLQNGVTLAGTIGAPYYEAMGLAALVRLHSYLGDQAGAAQWEERLTQLLERPQLPKECQSEGLAALALKAYCAAAYPLALSLAEAAQQQLAPSTVASRKAGVYLMLGHARVAMDQLDAAAEAYQQAITCCSRIGNPLLSSEAEAGLAHLALLAGNGWQGLQWVEAILPVLRDHPHASAVLPFFTYLTTYQVLVANEDPRAATLLAQAQQLLHERAAGITDPALRQRFLEEGRVQRVLRMKG